MGKLKLPDIQYEYTDNLEALESVYDFIFEKLIKEALVE
jgi:hypothetical protein